MYRQKRMTTRVTPARNQSRASRPYSHYACELWEQPRQEAQNMQHPHFFLSCWKTSAQQPGRNKDAQRLSLCQGQRTANSHFVPLGFSFQIPLYPQNKLNMRLWIAVNLENSWRAVLPFSPQSPVFEEYATTELLSESAIPKQFVNGNFLGVPFILFFTLFLRLFLYASRCFFIVW